VIDYSEVCDIANHRASNDDHIFSIIPAIITGLASAICIYPDWRGVPPTL